MCIQWFGKFNIAALNLSQYSLAASSFYINATESTRGYGAETGSQEASRKVSFLEIVVYIL